MQTTTTNAPNTHRSLGDRLQVRTWFRPVPEDGFLTFVLVAAVVYITVISVQSVTPPWAPGMGILTFTTGAGLVLGYVALQQRVLPGPLAHMLLTALGIWYAFAQTADAVGGGDRGRLAAGLGIWIRRALAGQTSSDNAVFLLFLGVLTYLLAYISLWLVVRTRRPWLAAIANGVVLLINLNWAAPDQLFFVVLYVLVTLLLLVRFTLAENMRVWRARGLRIAPDLTWDFVQTGALFSVLVLILADITPIGAANQAIQQYWNSPTNPVNALQDKWIALFGGLQGKNGPGGGVNFFADHLQLVGTVNLPDVPVLNYTTTDDSGQYLITQTFDVYDGSANWSTGPTRSVTYLPEEAEPATAPAVRQTTYNITLVNVPQGGQRYIFAPGVEAAGFNVAATASVSTISNVATQWQVKSPLSSRQSYVGRGYTSTATDEQLRAVPFPSAASDRGPDGSSPQFSGGILNEYLPAGDGNISSLVRQEAANATRGTTNMYDAALHIEDYLRSFVYSVHNPEPPGNEDAVDWFLQRREGFCTYFASAMALMGRSLGMPTRIASGFTQGTYDPNAKAYVVKGTAAHTWTQIYFGQQYGWINFEPTSGFIKFSRAVATDVSGAPLPTVAGGAQPTTSVNDRDKFANETDGNKAKSNPTDSPVVRIGIGLSGTVLLLLVAGALALLWWRSLFRSLSPAAMALARVGVLGRWAGAPPRRSQTPEEYADALSTVIPERRESLRTLSSAYSRERWGGSAGGGMDVAPLYDGVRESLVRQIVRRARQLPAAAIAAARRALHRARSGVSSR